MILQETLPPKMGDRSDPVMEKLYALKIRTLISTAFKEGFAFVFICLYLFFEYVRPQSIYPVLSGFPWVPTVIALTVFSGILFNEFNKMVPHLLNKLMLIYFVVVLLSSSFSYYPDLSFSRLAVFFNWLIIYFLIVSIVTNEKRFFIFLLSFLVYSFKMSQHGFISWAKRGFSFSAWGITGAPGWFHNSGEVGIQMCIFVPLAVAFIIATYKYLPKIWLGILLLFPITGVGTVIASSSRGALLGLFGASVWGVFKRAKVLIIGSVVLLVLSFAVIQIIPDEFMRRIESAGSDNTSMHRIERWQHGIEAMNRHPFLGVGFEAWNRYYPKYHTPTYGGSLLVHNIFVQCGSELGYSGLIVFCLMIIACFATTRKVRKMAKERDRFHFLISYGFDAALVGLLISGFFVTVLYYPYFWIHCALTTCLYTASLKKHVASSEEREGSLTYRN